MYTKTASSAVIVTVVWCSQTCMDCCQWEHNNKCLLLQQTAAVHHRSTKGHSSPARLHTSNKLRAQCYTFKDSQQLNSSHNCDGQLVSQSTQSQHHQLVSQSTQSQQRQLVSQFSSCMPPVTPCSDHLPVFICFSICSAAVAPGHHGAAVAIMSGGGSVKGLARLVQVRLVITPFACS